MAPSAPHPTTFFLVRERVAAANCELDSLRLPAKIYAKGYFGYAAVGPLSPCHDETIDFGAGEGSGLVTAQTILFFLYQDLNLANIFSQRLANQVIDVLDANMAMLTSELVHDRLLVWTWQDAFEEVG